MRIKKGNVVLLAVLMALALGIVGTTYAFYSAENNVMNMLITKGSEVYLAEYFSAEDLWLPGETKTKEVKFGNQNELDQVIRFRVTTEWFDNRGTPDDLTDDIPWTVSGIYTPEPAKVNYTSAHASEWQLMNGYYYYKKVLKKGTPSSPTETLAVIDSVTFSNALSNGEHKEDFSNKVCRITIEMQALDVNPDATRGEWNVTFTNSSGNLTWAP